MPMSRPRTAHISASERRRRSAPAKPMRPVATAPCGSSRITESAVIDLPDPLSPITPSTSPVAQRHRHVPEDGEVVDGDRQPLDGEEARSRLARPEEEAGRIRRRHRRREVQDHHPARLDRHAGEPRRARRPRPCRDRSPAGPCAGPARASAPLKSTPRAPAGRTAGGGARDEVEHGVGPLDRTRARGRCRRPPPPPARRRPRRAPRRWPPRGPRRAGRPRTGRGAGQHAGGRRGRSGSRAARAPRSPPPRRCRRPCRRVESSPAASPRITRGASRSMVRSKPERVELRPHDAAGEGDRGAAGGAQVGEEPAGLLEGRRDHRMARQPVERHAVEDHDPVGRAAPGAVLGDQPRQVAPPGDDGEAVGRHAGVSPPAW